MRPSTLTALSGLLLTGMIGVPSAVAQQGLGAVVCVGSETEALAGGGPVRRVVRKDVELVYRVGVDLGDREVVESSLREELDGYPEAWCAWSDPGDSHVVVVSYTGAIRLDLTLDREDPRFPSFAVGYGRTWKDAESSATTLDARFATYYDGSGYDTLVRENWTTFATADPPADHRPQPQPSLLATPGTPELEVSALAAGFDFGDDSGEWAYDDQCDDNRFVGEEAWYVHWTSGEYNRKDATDCRILLEAGRIRLRGASGTERPALDFGDDSGEWAHDDQCDDNRFVGDEAWYAHWTSGEYNRKDATDCRTLFEAGRIRLRSAGEAERRQMRPMPNPLASHGEGEARTDGLCGMPDDALVAVTDYLRSTSSSYYRSYLAEEGRWEAYSRRYGDRAQTEDAAWDQLFEGEIGRPAQPYCVYANVETTSLNGTRNVWELRVYRFSEAEVGDSDAAAYHLNSAAALRRGWRDGALVDDPAEFTLIRDRRE